MDCSIIVNHTCSGLKLQISGFAKTVRQVITRHYNVRMKCLITLVAMAAICCAPYVTQADTNAIWQQITLQLDAALPNQHPKLSNKLELYLGRQPGASWGSEEAAKVWRPWLMGYSAIYSKSDTGRKPSDFYNWFDAEGQILKVTETADTAELHLTATLADDPWIAGGKLDLTLTLKKNGELIEGSYTGTFDRNKSGPAGPAGMQEIKGKVTGEIASKPWPSLVKGIETFKPGEHPRLIFRASDVPRLKQRAETPEGKMILARLEKMLGNKDPKQALWHGYGYGLMYQLTGEQKWADLGKDYAKGVMDGTITWPRWGWWTKDGGYMRVGPSVAAVAVTYDLCYHGWDEAFRQEVAKAIQERIYPRFVDKPIKEETDFQFSPRSNHYGMANGGAGLAILAIKGDPGTDPKVIERCDRIFKQRLKRALTAGFGNRGWFYEGTFCGQYPSVMGMLSYMHALKVAEGLDYITNRDEARWMVTKWMYEVVRSADQAVAQYRGMYAKFGWGHLHGDFSIGFGIVPQSDVSDLLWFYKKTIEPDGIKEFDAKRVRTAVYAFVNWPIGVDATDPTGKRSRVLHDSEADFWVFRSGWQGEGDIVISSYGGATLLGLGLEHDLVGLPIGGKVEHLSENLAGTIAVSVRSPEAGKQLTALGFDFTGISGATAFIVSGSDVPFREPDLSRLPPALREKVAKRADPNKDLSAPANKTHVRQAEVVIGGYEVVVTTVQKGDAPRIDFVGDGANGAMVIGKRIIRFDGKKFLFEKVTGD